MVRSYQGWLPFLAWKYGLPAMTMRPSSAWYTCCRGRRPTGACCRSTSWTGWIRRGGARLWERTLGEPAPRSGVVVADAGDRLAGFAHFCPSRDEDADPARTGELSSIYLLPESWGRGVGRQLMTAALAGLAEAGYGQATLWVLDSNDRARRFYRMAGWAVDGAVKQEEGPGFTLTEVRYRRPLP
ncbi:MAG: GNAT family N-acetyltransferase [Actinobacteria bacterium]|nr:GNAT family N-acetyltransferase [Actinomycetota bacterium]